MRAVPLALIVLAIVCSERNGRLYADNAVIGTKAVCPVTGDTFTISKYTPVVEYNGDTYYFCCSGCDTKFMHNPTQYIKDKKSQPVEAGESAKKILYWTCSMHPEVKAETEGNCPICGMALLPVYEKESSTSLHLQERDMELAGIKIVPVVRLHLYREIAAFGAVAYDPALVIAQDEYLNALAMSDALDDADSMTVERARTMVEKSLYKLRLLGMDASEIQALETTRQVATSLVLPEHETWVYADVYESTIEWIHKGQSVMVTSHAHPGDVFEGRIVGINPTLNSETRSIKVRIRLTNHEMKLRPGMYVDVKIQAHYGAGTHDAVLAIPRDAVLDTGNQTIVWVYIGDGNFEPRVVRVGPVAVAYNDNRGSYYYPVMNGLKEKNLVVTNGNFLIDSERKITGVAALGYGGALEVNEKSPTPAGHQH